MKQNNIHFKIQLDYSISLHSITPNIKTYHKENFIIEEKKIKNTCVELEDY